MPKFMLKFILLCNGHCKDFVEFFKELSRYFFAGGGVGWEVNNKEQIYINVTLHIF